MLTAKIRSLLFLIVYNYLYLNNFVGYDNDGESDIIERIIDVYISANYSKTQLQEKPNFSDLEINTIKIFFNQFKLALPATNLEAKKYITWDKTSFILQSILLLVLTELEYIKNSENFEITTDEKKLITRHYLKVCQQYIDNQSVSLLHAILTKVLD